MPRSIKVLHRFLSMILKLITSLLVTGISGNVDEECPIPWCRNTVTPTCGSNGKIYFNHCDFATDNCKNGVTMVDWADCKADCASQVCTLEYGKACGSDGVIYGNQCALLGESCGKTERIVEEPLINCLEKICPDNCSDGDQICKEAVNNCRLPHQIETQIN